jgi:ATP-dependent RNA helicase DeaD
VNDFQTLHLTASVADALAALGWSPNDAAVRDAVPTVARGHNLVAVTPPAAAYAGPVLGGVLSRLAGPDARRALLICPPAELDEFGALAHVLVRGTALRLQMAHSPSRAARRLKAGGVDLLITSAETVATLLERSALKADALDILVLAWPERWAGPDTLAGLMQDLSRDTQRVILAADPQRTTDLGERFARKALVVGGLPAGSAEPGPAGPVRTVGVAWRRRASALGDIIELLDPASLAVWTADRSHHSAIALALPAGDPSIRVLTGDSTKAEVVVAFDPPSPERLRQLLTCGEVVLLVPPGTESYVGRLAAPRRPLKLPGLIDAVGDAAAVQRALVARTIESGHAERALLTLAPLFERYDPAAVAAAVYDLWVGAAANVGTASAAAPTPAPAPPAPNGSQTARVYVGIGRTDGATANDLVAVLTKEVRVPPANIGRIELRDAFCLVELPASDAERIAGALNGTTIRRKRVVARLDRGGKAPKAPRRPR